MNFLSPWFLAGAALIAGPIIAHLIRRATRERIEFSAMRFLDPSAPRLDKRSRLRHPWLLALRCLIVALLALGFARPFMSGKHAPTIASVKPRLVAVVLDESGSMQRGDLWSKAVDRVLSIAEKLRAGDHLALVSVSGKANALVSFESWDRAAAGSDRVALVRSALANRQPNAGPTYLDLGIETALDLLQTREETSGTTASKQIEVVSDLTAGARVSGLASREWPKDCEVVLENIGPKNPRNASLQWLGWTTDPVKGLNARVRISRTKEGPTPSMRLRVIDQLTGKDLRPSQPVTVAPGDAQAVSLLLGKLAADAAIRVELEGDEEPFDNVVYAVPPQVRTVSVAYWGKHDTADTHHARFYLDRATNGWKEPIVQIRAFDPQQPFDPSALAQTQLVIITEPLKPEALAAVKGRLNAGAFALVLLDGAVDINTVANLSGESGWQLGKTDRPDALIGKVDFQHPLFSLFAEPRFSDFTHIRFWQPHPLILPLDTKATVAARFDDGTAAVVEAPVGRGRLVVWGGDWQPQAGQWVLSSKFVPWLQALVERALGGPERPSIAEIGDVHRLWSDGTAKWHDLKTPEGLWTDREPERPGLYDLQVSGTTRRVALEMAASESRIEPLGLETWDQLGVPLKADLTPTADNRGANAMISNQAAAEAEAEQKLWRWLMIAATVLLAGESLVALRLARRGDGSAHAEVAGA